MPGYQPSTGRRRSTGQAPLRVLVLYWAPGGPSRRIAISQHLEAVQSLGAGHETIGYNAVDAPPAWLRTLGFDAIVLHTTFLCRRWIPGFDAFREACSWIGALECPKVALPQDDYDHAEVLDEWLAEMRASTVLCLFDATQNEVLYPTHAGGARFEQVLTGYVDDGIARRLGAATRPLAERPADVVYRATRLPYWFGSQGQLKHRVGEVGRVAAAELGLRADISTAPGDAVLGARWLEFMQSGRAALGTESGSSVLDRRGEIRRAIEAILAEEPALTFEELSHRMPSGWDDHRFTTLSPRHLEAAVTRTPQLLVEGSFSGALESERHYLAIRRDFSNLAEVLDRSRDTAANAQMAERAHEDLVASGTYSYRRLSDAVARAVSAGAEQQAPRRPSLAVARAAAGGRSALGRPLGKGRALARALRARGSR